MSLAAKDNSSKRNGELTMITNIAAFGALISYVSNGTHLQPHQVDVIKEYVEDATKPIAPPSGSASCADVNALLEAVTNLTNLNNAYPVDTYKPLC